MNKLFSIFYVMSGSLIALGVMAAKPLTIALGILIGIHITLDVTISKWYTEDYDKRKRYQGISSVIMAIGYLIILTALALAAGGQYMY